MRTEVSRNAPAKEPQNADIMRNTSGHDYSGLNHLYHATKEEYMNATHSKSNRISG